ncbi:Wzz/FepE/Etk N-terminal domain-containing protein [Pseudomonadota bacterium]|jgi:LPS O-antigen subunit length determinant protein (WzzB/FepE family)|nr:Wzz/FepE/Etk N-terminal domain-containing protein [Pseudomonadota bacterium]
MQDSNRSREPFNNQEVDFLEIIKEAWNVRLYIIIFILISTFFGIGSSLIKQNEYSSSAMLKPVNISGSSISQSNSQYGSLASLAGINLGKGNASQSSEVIATILSRDFFKHLLSFENILPIFIAANEYDPVSKKLSFDSSVYDAQEKKLLVSSPSYLELYETYAGMIGVNQDDDSDMFTLSVTHISPEFSYTFLSLLIKEVNNVTRQKAIAQSEKSLDYLYQQLSQTTQFDIELSVHQLIESQLNTQMLATVRPEYLVQIFDSPFIPVKKSGPNRRYTVLVYFFASIFIAIVGVLASYFYKLSFRKMST